MIGARGEWLGGPRTRLGLVIALVAVGLVPPMTARQPWSGSWKMALDHGTFGITTLGPVAAGIACTVYVRIRRARFAELLGQASRPWAGWVAPALAVWAVGAAAVLVICLVTTTAAWATGAHAYPSLFWVVLPALAVLGADVAIGTFVGSVSGHYWAAPWAAALTFTLYVLSSIGVIPAVFRTGGVTGSLSGETFDACTLTLQTFAACGIATVAMVLSHRDLFRRTAPGFRVLAGLVVVGAGVALFRIDGGDARYVLREDPVYECREGVPTVCMLEETIRPLDDLSVTMQRLAEHLTAAGAELPRRFVQENGLPRPQDGVLRMHEELEEQVSHESAAASLATPADCAAYASSSGAALPPTYFAVDAELIRWLLVQEGWAEAPGGDHPLADWWALPVEQQRAWVRETYAALRDCRLQDLRLPR